METTLNQRFIAAYSELRKLGQVKNKTAFAKIGDFLPTYWTGYEQGTRKVSIEVASRVASHFGINFNWLAKGEGPMFQEQAEKSASSDVHAYALLSSIPVVELPRVPSKARASFFFEVPHRHMNTDIFDTVLHRLPPGKTAADYSDAIVFDIEGDSMEPSLKSGQQVIAWPVSEGKWDSLHNATCVVAYGDSVTVKRITDNELFAHNRLTLRATGGSGGSFAVSRDSIQSIYEVRELYGTQPYNFYE